jgi:type I restriction enzyme, S subunit
VDSGIPYVSTRDFHGDDEIDFENAKPISEEDYQMLSRKIKPEIGDILLSRYGTIGEVRRVKTAQRFQVSYSVATIKVLPFENIAEYLVLALRSDFVQKQIKRDVRATAQPDLGLGHIRQFAILLPPLAEQRRIVAEVERRLSVVQELEGTLAVNLARAERLRQSILKRAFEGKLV